MMNQLAASCPWCGADRIESIAYLNSVNFKMWRAKCKNCGATGPSHLDPETAIKAWNKRPEMPVAIEILKDETDVPKEDFPKPKQNVDGSGDVLDPDWKIKKYEELAKATLRLWEMCGVCSCVEELKCIPCQVRGILRELKVMKS